MVGSIALLTQVSALAPRSINNNEALMFKAMDIYNKLVKQAAYKISMYLQIDEDSKTELQTAYNNLKINYAPKINRAINELNSIKNQMTDSDEKTYVCLLHAQTNISLHGMDSRVSSVALNNVEKWKNIYLQFVNTLGPKLTSFEDIRFDRDPNK